MRIICIDDEPLILQMTVALCRELPEKPDVCGFSTAADALKWLAERTADIALLDSMLLAHWVCADTKAEKKKQNAYY